MFTDALTLTIRNIALLQLALLLIAPEKYALVYGGMCRFWKSLRNAAHANPDEARVKGKNFWEIDMSRFEP